jgi:hypothetical protein
MSFPPKPPSGRSAVQGGLKRLRDWRTGSAATATVMAVVLPFAVLWHANDLVAIVTSLVVAGPFAIACHVTRRWRVARLAMFPELARLPELADTRQRLVRPRNRRRLAGRLRQTAAITHPPHRYDCCPLYNPNARAEELHTTLTRIRAGISDYRST